ncbi:transmembrane protein, putative (macronuclear) [Tetrahymena thermophila SB210]|uniref:Transmembrane protein, putative n=1 Tax=Tetrahymena thermophila (strain SB210) TaxID=312017 RepID=W7XF44_TETTS|nr:transmembrane protein, putative [Tetrahymena thermophila SB210]EWS72606.1 transmembrane protein, putative [Tetrahymena thermophila SB210]|eukprot:XP_012654889.1 transmembrane protein, putative [Tetrahymena thermophila SB210]
MTFKYLKIFQKIWTKIFTINIIDKLKQLKWDFSILFLVLLQNFLIFLGKMIRGIFLWRQRCEKLQSSGRHSQSNHILTFRSDHKNLVKLQLVLCLMLLKSSIGDQVKLLQKYLKDYSKGLKNILFLQVPVQDNQSL